MICGKFIASALALTLVAAATSRQAWPNFTAINGKAPAPAGWRTFCVHYRDDNCQNQSERPEKIALTPHVGAALDNVNTRVNKAIKPVPDLKHWGTVNKWAFAEDGKGDCKDYVLVKQKILIEMGLPRQ